MVDDELLSAIFGSAFFSLFIAFLPDLPDRPRPRLGSRGWFADRLRERGFVRDHFLRSPHVVRGWIMPVLIVGLTSMGVGVAVGAIRVTICEDWSALWNHEAEDSPVQASPDRLQTLFSCLKWSPQVFNRDAATLVLALGALSFGLVRWNLAREEAAMDRYLEHRRAVNEMIREAAKDSVGKEEKLISWGAQVLGMVSESWKNPPTANPLLDIFVYSELDVLELAYIKYKRGLIRDDAAYRVSQVMYARCGDQHFRDTALVLVEKGNYSEGFDRVIRLIADSASKPTKAPAPGDPAVDNGG